MPRIAGNYIAWRSTVWSLSSAAPA